MPLQQRLDLIYSSQFDTVKGNIIEVTDDFLEYIDQNESLIISGQHDNDVILSTDEKTYKLRGINLPTTLLTINDKGTIELELSHFLKLENYNHQYHRIYSLIKSSAPSEDEFDQLTIYEILDRYALEDHIIKDRFKISLKEFAMFEKFVDFAYMQGKRLFIPITVLLKYMRNLMLHLNQNDMLNRDFTFHQLQDRFDPQIKSLIGLNHSLFEIVAKKFHFDVLNIKTDATQKMQIQTERAEQQNETKYKITYESILHFITLELATTKSQYVAKQMDELIKQMLQIYIPIGMETPQQKQALSITKKVIAQYFIETTRNNTLIRIHYDPLEVQSSLKGRIKFMSTFKNKFTRDEIKGVFEGLVVPDGSKEIKLINHQGQKVIDMDDLLLKNFRKFNELYEIKLILPK